MGTILARLILLSFLGNFGLALLALGALREGGWPSWLWWSLKITGAGIFVISERISRYELSRFWKRG